MDGGRGQPGALVEFAKDGGLQAWEKRVLVTQWAGNSWAKLCETYDFEASARSLGMLMTADGSEDDQIKVQGLTEPYTFTDADGGSEGAESEVEEDKEELGDVLDKEGEEGGEGEEDPRKSCTELHSFRAHDMPVAAMDFDAKGARTAAPFLFRRGVSRPSLGCSSRDPFSAI